MTSSVETLLSELRAKLGPRARIELDRLAKTPEAQAVLQRTDDELLEERRGLVEELRHVPRRHEKARKDAHRAVLTAVSREEQARLAYLAARAAALSSKQVADGLEHLERKESWELQRRLLATADERLEQAEDHWRLLENIARCSVATVPVGVAPAHWSTGRENQLLYSSNGEQVEALMVALRSAQEDVQTMRLQALSRSEVSERLSMLLSGLAPMLKPLRLDVASLDEHGAFIVNRERSVEQLNRDAIQSAGGVLEPDDVAGR